MKKWVCTVCGYVYEGPEAPEICPVCKAPKEKFAEQSGDRAWAAEHVVGVAQGAPEEIIQGLRENFQGECTEVGMYLAMARVAHRVPCFTLADCLQHECPAVRAFREFRAFSGNVHGNRKLRLRNKRRLHSFCVLTHTG